MSVSSFPTKRFVLFTLPILAAIFTFFNKSVMKTWFAYSSYYFMHALVMVWLWTLAEYLKNRQFSFRAFFKAYRWDILIALGLTIFVFVSVKPEFRVLNDETHLVSSSRSLFYEKRADYPFEEVFWNNQIEAFSREIPVRPLLFPFLLQLVHCVLGYSVQNVFILNFILLFFLFCILAIALRRLWGTPWNYMAILLILSQPIFPLSAASGGFELLQAVFFVLCFTLLYQYLSNPQPAIFALLFSSLLMLSHIRYESPIYLVLILSFLVLFRAVKFDALFSCWPFILSPALMLTIFWQRILRPASTLALYRPTDKRFSIEHLISHTIIFLKELPNFYSQTPFANLVNFLGLAGIAYFLFLAARKKLAVAQPARTSIFILAVSLIVTWGIMLSAHTGRITRMTTGRYYLLFIIFFAMAIIFLMRRVRPLKLRPVYAAVICAAIMFFYYPAAIANPFFARASFYAKDYKAVSNFLETLGDRKIVVISEQSKSLIINNYYGCIKFRRAAAMRKTLRRALRRRLISDVYVVQTVMLSKLKPAPGQILPPQFEIQTVHEERTGRYSLIRISRVAKIR
jgi:hypothetical protein